MISPSRGLDNSAVKTEYQRRGSSRPNSHTNEKESASTNVGVIRSLNTAGARRILGPSEVSGGGRTYDADALRSLPGSRPWRLSAIPLEKGSKDSAGRTRANEARTSCHRRVEGPARGASPILSGGNTESATVNWLGERGSRRKVAHRGPALLGPGDFETAQELLWASNTHALRGVLQAMDAAGKDGTIKHVMSGVNPQGCQVVSFKAPSEEELNHDFLWRCRKRSAGAGPHRDLQPLLLRGSAGRAGPPGASGATAPADPAMRGKSFGSSGTRTSTPWSATSHTTAPGSSKIFLHVSKDEQKKRLPRTARDPAKNWKFSVADLIEREHWDEYQAAYEEAIAAHVDTLGSVVCRTGGSQVHGPRPGGRDPCGCHRSDGPPSCRALAPTSSRT